MIRDVIFNDDKSALDDWNIVLTDVEIPLPAPKTSVVDIAGSDGVLDLSEVLTGDVKFSNRDIKLTFEIMDGTNYVDLISEISNYIHGQNCTFTFSDDDTYYYEGRATIDSWSWKKNVGDVVIKMNAEPYKYEIDESVIYISLNNDTKSLVIPNGRKSVCPNLKITGTVTMVYEGYTYELEEGEGQLLNFILRSGDNNVTLSGNGTLTITYRKGVF